MEKESTGANKGIILKFNKLGAAPHINCRQARMQQQRGSALAPSANTSKQARREEMTAELQQLQQQLQKQQEQVEQKKVTEGLWASEAAALITPAEAAAAAASEQQQSSMQGLWACAAAPVPDLFSLAATEQQKEQQQPSSLWASAASPVSDLISPAALAAAEASKVAASTTPSSAPVAPGFEYHASLYSNTSLALLPPTRASMSSGLYQAEAPELNRDAIRYKVRQLLCFWGSEAEAHTLYALSTDVLRSFLHSYAPLQPFVAAVPMLKCAAKLPPLYVFNSFAPSTLGFADWALFLLPSRQPQLVQQYAGLQGEERQYTLSRLPEHT